MVKKKDLTKKKISEGVACIGCSTDHFMTASAYLDEAARMAVEGKEFDHPEIAKRVGRAKKELDVMERIDLSTDKIKKLKGKERGLAEEALKKSGEIRHGIMGAKSISDIVDLSGIASKFSDDFWAKVWKIAKGPIVCPTRKRLKIPVKVRDYTRDGCPRNKVKNPKTNRCIKACPSGKIRNMKTGKCVTARR